VVGPASVSRRHEGPSRNGRQPTEREVEAAAVGGPATSQGRIWIRIASSGRADEPGQRTVSSASLAWRALCLLADAPMLPGWDASGRGHWAQLRQDPRPLPQKAGEHTPSEEPVRLKADALGGTSPPTGCAAPALRCQVADSPDRKTARTLPTLGGVEPLCHAISYRMALIIRLIIQTILLVRRESSGRRGAQRGHARSDQIRPGRRRASGSESEDRRFEPHQPFQDRSSERFVRSLLSLACTLARSP
jgi:hypothetical protein